MCIRKFIHDGKRIWGFFFGGIGHRAGKESRVRRCPLPSFRLFVTGVDSSSLRRLSQFFPNQ